ncbi:BRO family protein [Nitrospirillum pindoramense]|uniref:Prophage antirepressor-like protein n=1 Tax=Nitrospirillum amazonense TaxID=28077 RepID=A0A560H6J1_9PROT|nr:BRO family protein [Nitrospirillum amazonense]TWB41935.1 prophage antirepressor-like protein [Nitrospirillum amazonense]
MSDLIPFSFEDNPVRVIKRAGEPWFVAADIAKVLEIGRTDDAVRRLDDDERGTDSIRTPGGAQEMTIINESGLYSLVLTSRKPAARRFKKWVTGEVLPAIRKTGGYMVAAPEETPEQLALRALTVLQATVDRQKAELAAALPKVEVHDRIVQADGSLTVTEAAKAFPQ